MKKLLVLLSMFSFVCCNAAVFIKEQVIEDDKTFADIPQIIKKAHWIVAETYPFFETVNLYSQFRICFDSADLPKIANLFITADQSYRLYVNGQYINAGPARGYQHSWSYDEIDILPYIKEGKNVLAVRVYGSGRNTFAYLTSGYTAFLFALDLGDRQIVSDSKIKSRRQIGVARETAQYSNQLANQEMVDLNIEDTDWKNVDFDDSSWTESMDMGVYNIMPYYKLQARGIPMFEVKDMPAPKLVGVSKGATKSSEKFVRNINILLTEEGTSHTPVKDSVTFAKVDNLSDGQFQSFLFDFGKVVTGMPILKIENAKGGEIVDMLLAESYQEDMSIFPYHTLGSRAALSNRVICKKGNQEYDFYHLMGFRYMIVRVRNASDITVTPTLRWSAYPMESNGRFITSDDNLNAIWQASVQTQRICSLDAYVDTPWREQAQWWGDARVQSWNTFFISGDARLLRRGIQVMSEQKVPNGLTYGHAPTTAHNCILPDYSITWVLTLWDYYWQTGSIEAYQTHRDTLMGLVKYFDTTLDEKTNLLKFDERYWLFLDWTDIQREGCPSILNLWWLYAMDRMTQLCLDNGLDEDAQFFDKKASDIRKAITKNLLAKDGLMSDGILPNGDQSIKKSLHSQTLAKLCNIEGFDFKKASDELILPYLRGQLKTFADPSAYWVVYILQLMADEGYTQDVVNYIALRWKEMGEFGTTFEDFHTDPMENISRSHAWSAHPAFLLPQIIGGVRQMAPAWKEVSFKPNFLVEEAAITYPTPQGNINVYFRQNKLGTFDCVFTKPSAIEVQSKEFQIRN